jgi:hypothetical protein
MIANRDDLHTLDPKQRFRPEEDWHVFPLAIPRRSITGSLVWGKVLRRWDDRRWIYKKYIQDARLSSAAG